RLGGLRVNVHSPRVTATTEDGLPGRAIPIQPHALVDGPFSPHAPYDGFPPTSGAHLPSLASWGAPQLPLPPQPQVHNLEVGGVIVQYRCDAPCDSLAGRLGALTEPYDRVVVAPAPQLEAAIALSAFGRVETLEAFDPERIVRFIEAFQGKDHRPESTRGS